MKVTLTTLFMLPFAIFAQQLLIPADGGGMAPVSIHDEMSPLQRDAIMADIQQNEAMLKSTGKWPSGFGNKSLVTELLFPLDWNDGFNDYGFYGISGFVDHDEAYPNMLLDYDCGARTYDTPGGYNHQGTDYFLWPFSWNMMQDEAVQIIAAAPGMIVGRYDGNFDQNCVFNPGSWNAVYIRHDDGSLAWYGHMKNGSVTVKELGDMVTAGEYLGLVGSSGNSTGPHLHFELYDADNNLIDPYSGLCNDMNATTWWTEQPDYIEPQINRMATHDAPPFFPPCPEPEEMHLQDHFTLLSLGYFAFYAKDLSDTDLVHLSIIDANGEVWNEWDFLQPYPYYAASFWYWWYTLPEGPEGIWEWRAEMHGTTYTHAFVVDSSATEIAESPGTFFLQTHYQPSEIHLQLTIPMADQINIAVFNVAGQRIAKYTEFLTPGSHAIHIPAIGYANGIYFIQVSTEKGKYVRSGKIFVHD